jgi:hypothetical protein
MERTFKLIICLIAVFASVGCGLQTAEESGSYQDDPSSPPPACTDCDAGVPDSADQPDAEPDVCAGYGELPPPVRSDAAWQLKFHLRYLPPDTNSVQVLGDLPGMGGQSGIPAPCQDAECTLEIQHEEDFRARTYTVTYVRGLPGEDIGGDDWASYGKEAAMLACMPSAAQDWISCELEYRLDGSVAIVSCGLEIYVSESGDILPAGNMTGFGGIG